MMGITVKRRQGVTSEEVQSAKGLGKTVMKLSEPKPFGLVLLPISLLAVSYGSGFAWMVFGLMYLSSVNATKMTTAELDALLEVSNRSYHKKDE